MKQPKCDDSFRVHVPPEERERLEFLARMDGRKLSQWARKVLLEHAEIVEVRWQKLEGPRRNS